MKTSDFDYELPEELIAQTPVSPRDHSRLLVYDRQTKETFDRHFYDVTDYLKKGDVLVVNETKVIPARLYGKKRGTETDFEFLLLKRLQLDIWEVIMRPGKKLKPGGFVDFGDDLCAELLCKKEDGVCEVRFHYDGVFDEHLDPYGKMPLPPYITEKLEEKERYQTVYAKEDGSAAAPTAGLHFTPELMRKIEEMGVTIVKILLHVGLGTFRPMKEDTVEEHIMHSEYYSVSEQAARMINDAKKEGRRVIAVGTTSVRTLESAACGGRVQAGSADTDIFIYPGYDYQIVDALITNFHLPKSTLIMLVSAFCGREETLRIYRRAVEERYRFFSFGDAMLII
ncbi:MAG: tRNA preQ1(34) S-adenosylmethionine ribosyltransferase-isomerase QueA [Christensenella hongkongensis]|uniref:tRNA preQ1(34) S-adenosylmethionine ribosyltransferase-isomerase QueA n=1 Tax=Christensenella hongkongensis TaxID=270498 RepID=UPI002A74FD9B|nr:tRNA preQ1(34) S-adenosylmethionine ribosyltransferase-isomerase QueA [Christensenella hongkongensis]MDY3004170.1 tRNA preQ1(34) S-adenosylmethionine ribosyltransferase-isomerase QueA [Christensenella hongkongensis]